MEGRHMRVKRVHQGLHSNREFKSRRIRQKVIPGIILIVVVAALFVTFRTLSVSANASSNSTQSVVRLNNAGPESIGIRYGQSNSQPGMTQQQVIQIAI